MNMPSSDEIKGKWKQQMGAAKIAWGKLTDDELLQAEGHQQKLTGLVQERRPRHCRCLASVADRRACAPSNGNRSTAHRRRAVGTQPAND